MKTTALNCPQKASHQTRLNQTCQACGELIPGHGMYTPEEFQRYFAPPGYGQPLAHPVFETPEMKALTEKQASLWAEHERARLAYTDAIFKVEDAAAEDRAETLYEGTKLILREINRIDELRKGMHQQALWAESYPPDAPAGSIAPRIAAAIRGGGA